MGPVWLWHTASWACSWGYLSFQKQKVPEYNFSISDTSETKTSMETASANMALVCVTFTAATT